MPACNTYCITWVSLTLGVGYLFTAASVKRSRCSISRYDQGGAFFCQETGSRTHGVNRISPRPLWRLALLMLRTVLWHTQRGREQLPLIRGQGQWLRVPGCDSTGTAREATLVRGQGRWLGGATPRPRPGTAAGRSHPAPKARGRGREDQPTSKEWLLHWHRRA